MINLNTDPVYLVEPSTLMLNVKDALRDIKECLVSVGVDHKIKMVKRSVKDQYCDSSGEYKPALLQNYSAPELTTIILDEKFISSLQITPELINTLLINSAFGGGSSQSAAAKAKEHGYLDALVCPVKQFSPITYYGQRGDQHVLNGFWRFITIPLFIRLWQSKSIILPLTSHLSHYLATTDNIKNIYADLCTTESASDDLKLFVQCYKANFDATDLSLYSNGLRITASSKNIKRDYPAFLRLLLSTDWYTKLNLIEFKETFVIHCHYWMQWEKGQKRAMTPILKRDLYRAHGGKDDYLPFGRIIQAGNKLIPSYRDDLEELRGYVVSDAERILTLVQLNITKDELLQMNSTETWEFWGKLDIQKLLYDEYGNLSEERLRLFLDVDYNLLKNWDDYGKNYVQSASSSTPKNYKGGTKYLIKYLIYINVWFQENKPHFEFPTNFSQFTRSIFLVRDSENETLPKTFADFIIEYGSYGVCDQFGKFIRWMQSASPYALETVHSQPSSIVSKFEFQKKWWGRHTNKVKSKGVVEDDKRAFESDEYNTLKYFMTTLEGYFSEVQKFILQRIIEAKDYAPKAKRLWTETSGPETDSKYYIKVSETALLDLGWESLSLKYKAKLDERIGVMPATRKAMPTQLNFISIDLEKSKQLISAEHFEVKFLEVETGEIKQITLNGEIPVITPVRRLYNEELDVTLMMPMLNVLRAQLISTDLGIRHKHGFSLDADEFDAHVDQLVDFELGVTTLKITTDKVKTKPWLRPISYSTMDTLYKEREFREAYTSHFIREYEYNDALKFKAIFAQPNTGKPPSSKTRTPCWNQLLVAFSGLMSKIKLRPVRYLRWCPISTDKTKLPTPINTFSEDDSSVLAARRVMPNSYKDEKGNEIITENEFTLITLRAIHTPHSTRNSLISSLTDHMELADIAALVGQKSIATTVHYNQVTKGKYKKYLDSHRVAVSAQSSESSNLVKSFDEDRTKTEALFGFTSVDVHQEDKRFSEGRDQKPRPTGVLILRTAKHKDIAFADTHICPFKMNCPDEITEENRGYRKCGVCRAKVTGIDHPPAIARKIELLEIELLNAFLKHKRYKSSKGKNETNFKVVYDEIAEEIAGWELTLQVTEHQRQQLLKKDRTYDLDQYPPEMLDESIQISRDKAPVDELLLTSIEEAEKYPSLSGDSNFQLEIARRLKAKILFSLAKANPNEIESYLSEVAESDASSETLMQVSSLVKSIIKTNLIKREQLIKLISDERQHYALPMSRKPSFLKIESDVNTEGNRLIESTFKPVVNDE